MVKIRARGEQVRKFILQNIAAHPENVVAFAAQHFGCSRQAVHKHMQRLLAEGAITQAGQTRNKVYLLAPLVEWHKDYVIGSGLTEDEPWIRHVSPALGSIADNVRQIWHYGFTEIFNNALDHSGARVVNVRFAKTAATTDILIYDDGVGIFRKIQAALDLLDERHAVLELAKGKFTTDPKNHSGEGIFFSSRMFDEFEILSGGVYFAHAAITPEDWIQGTPQPSEGTLVRMVLNNHTSKTTKKVFDRFSVGDDYGFTKTVVPVRLAQYGDDNLVSRSQARRLLARIEKFKVVVFDFSKVTSIGQAFADEIFRVFSREHPAIEVTWLNANSEVKRMISRALSHAS